jgi:hypothetical protein
MRTISLLAIILLVSCDALKTNKYHYMPNEYKSDLGIYDTVIFSGNSTLDTFYVYKITNAFIQTSLSGSSLKGPYERYGFECLFYYQPDCNCESNFPSNISFSGEQYYGEGGHHTLYEVYNTYRIVVGYNTMHYRPVLKYNADYGIDTLLQSIEIGDSTYRNVYKTEFSMAKSGISEIYYHYKRGIVRYIKNGNTFDYLHSSD